MCWLRVLDHTERTAAAMARYLALPATRVRGGVAPSRRRWL